MSKYIPLSVTEHGGKAWRKKQSYAFAESQSLAPVLLEELPHVITTMPLAFLGRTEGEETGRYELVAMLSATPGVNLFLNTDGRWLGGYVPAVFRGYPFRVLSEGSKASRHVLCFDEESGLLAEAGEPDSQPFFNEDGTPAEGVAKVLEFMKQQEQGHAQTQQAVDLLARHGLIAPWQLRIQNPEGEPIAVNGLFRVDETALKALDADTLKALQEGNALALAYAQLLAQHRMGGFRRLYALHAQRQEGGQPDSDMAAELSVDELFGENHDDMIRFNS